MKLLLLGCNGQVGWELQRSLAVLGDVVALQRDASCNPQGLSGDLGDTPGLEDTITRVQPDVIVNAAAYTAVDRAEAEPDDSHQINALAPAVIARSATKTGAFVVHYSSDYVFDGGGDQPWQETDAPSPLSAYGRSKLAGDEAVARCPRHLILRTSWVYGVRGGNFPRTMLRLAQERDQLSVVSDQWGAPTSAALLADITAHCLHQLARNPALAGLYHCAASGTTSWHGYAQQLFQQARALGWALRATPDKVLPVSSSHYPTVARRPANSRLDCSRLQTRFGLRLPPWQQGLTHWLQSISESPSA
ncbi:MAG: dTDP-4-dehydrorhamnose reductase [Rhodoferax sp.]|nr:dTDP-4-dehydrorhamnose reductase [Rhodoferax sp.]